MTAEQQFFFQVISDHLLGRQTHPPEGLDWESAASCAARHQLESFFYIQCKHYLTEHPELFEVAARFNSANGAAMFYYYNRSAFLDRLAPEMRRAGIPFVTVRGVQVAQCYPIPAMRTMGDTDLVVHGEDRARTHELLLSLGCHGGIPSAQTGARRYFKSRMEFELHDRLLYDDPGGRRAIPQYFNQHLWEHARDGALDWDFHFMLLVAHLRARLLEGRAGFRKFLDLAVVSQAKREAIRWPEVEARLDQLGLLNFLRVCLGFCQRWFSLDAPIAGTLPENDFFEQVTAQLYSGGVFGPEGAQRSEHAPDRDDAGLLLRFFRHFALGEERTRQRARLDARWRLP